MPMYLAIKKQGVLIKTLVGPFYGERSISEEISTKAGEKLKEGEDVVITSGAVLVKAGLLNKSDEEVTLDTS